MSRGGDGEVKRTNHHLDLLDRRGLPDHEPSSLNAGLAIPQSPRLAVGSDTVRVPVLSDVELRRTTCRCFGGNRLSRSVDADRYFRLFVTRQSVDEPVNQVPSRNELVTKGTPSSSAILTNLDFVCETRICFSDCKSFDSHHRARHIQPPKDLPVRHGNHG